jgi:hypothetical protein
MWGGKRNIWKCNKERDKSEISKKCLKFSNSYLWKHTYTKRNICETVNPFQIKQQPDRD